MSERNLQAGQLYEADELPENVMNDSGKPEFLGDGTFVLADEDGHMYELERAFKCSFVGKVSKEDGSVAEIEGKRV